MVPLELLPTPLEELPRPEPDPDVLDPVLGLEVLGLVEVLLPALDPEVCRDSQSVFARPVSELQSVELPALELLLGDVVLLEPEVLGELMLPLEVLLPVLGLAVLGLVALPEEPLPIEPLELPEVCATETPAAPRNAAATAAQRSLLVIVHS